MQITREDRPDRQVALLIAFEPQEIEPALQKTYQRLVGKVNVPGFRPGKAPRQIFERYVGRDALVREASESLMAGPVKEAIEREGLQTAELSDAHLESTDPLQVHVIFNLEPLVEVPDYTDIRVARDPVAVTEDQVARVIRSLRSREAEWHAPAEPRPARYGDRVTVDLETFTIDGPVAQMTGPGQTMDLSEETGPAWPREIDENLVGMRVGEEKDFAITFPAAYTEENLRGRDATVHVKLTELQEADLPDLDDAFAQRAAQVETVAALRQRVQDSLLHEAEDAARGKQVRAALDAMLARSTVEVPAVMIEQEIDRRYDRLTAELQKRRIAPARYFTYEGTTEKAWREAQRDPARAALKELLVLREFAGREQIAVDPAEVEAAIAEQLVPFQDSPQAEQLRGMIDTPEQRERISNRLFDRKLTDRLIAIAEGRGAEPPAAETPAISDTVPALVQEPGPLETAGGAVAALGAGAVVDAEESNK